MLGFENIEEAKYVTSTREKKSKEIRNEFEENESCVQFEM